MQSWFNACQLSWLFECIANCACASSVKCSACKTVMCVIVCFILLHGALSFIVYVILKRHRQYFHWAAFKYFRTNCMYIYLCLFHLNCDQKVYLTRSRVIQNSPFEGYLYLNKLFISFSIVYTYLSKVGFLIVVCFLYKRSNQLNKCIYEFTLNNTTMSRLQFQIFCTDLC